MDERGYAFTPLVFLMLIPVMIIAINYAEIVNEANMIATIAMGGDVTFSSATTIISAIEKGAGDAGRNSAYNATRWVIDNNKFHGTSPSNNSQIYIRQNIVNALNVYIIETCRKLENQTGREIYINNIPINNYTNQTFFLNDVTITQTDPFGFYVNVRAGIPIKVVQKDQVYEGTTPNITAYVSIEGLEDPWIWMNSKQRSSNVIYKYQYYIPAYGGYPAQYRFDDIVDNPNFRIQYLWDCLNGTDNPSGISERPFYFPDPYGLSFFDRLENKTNSSSTSPAAVRMSTFFVGDPLLEDHGTAAISRLDHEYVLKVPGTSVIVRNPPEEEEMVGPTGSVFYLSTFYKNFLSIENRYN